MPKIRPYGDDDFAGCIALWDSCGLTCWYNDPSLDIPRWQRSDCAEIFVAERDGKIVGTVCCGHDGHRGWLYYVAIDPALQGAGLGRRMVRHAENWLAERGILKVQLIVRDGNRPVIGFYTAIGYAYTPHAILARWLRLPKEPPENIDLPPEVELAAGRDPKVRFTITYLEMTERPALAPVHPPMKTKFALMLAEQPTVGFYRYLYNSVGGDWRWWYRRQMTDEELAGILADERVEVFVLYVDGAPAGYFELDRREEPTIDLAYFGLMPHCVGRGLGRYLLYSAIEQAWSYEPQRLTVNTNTMDHPRALPLYQRMGFVPYRQEEQEIIDPQISGIIPA
ncbi:GNAT family acetyltransferase [Pelagibius marinus]|uniref:GNAT family acetyltransferase n=1 Tax=Pelagibius marinus TaxID=2762760 RepID=UPI00187257F2|nr:GNAT family acetyltransferase [Pelagibius marinus]